MLIPIYMGRMMMPGQMKMDLLKMPGTMMMPVSGMTYGVGLVIHAMMSIIFASFHASFYLWLDIEGNLAVWGLLFGAVHWMMVGVAFGMMKSSVHRGHSRRRSRGSGFLRPQHGDDDGRGHTDGPPGVWCARRSVLRVVRVGMAAVSSGRCGIRTQILPLAGSITPVEGGSCAGSEQTMTTYQTCDGQGESDESDRLP